MTKRTEAVPATTGEASSAPATASENESGLPKVSETGGEWNSVLLRDVLQVCTGGDLGDKGALEKARAGIAAMRGIAPDDVIADMVSVQLVAAHEATMRCFKLAVVPDQPFSVVHECLSQANKLSRTTAALIEALNRHRGKSGQQTVRVEHVTVKDGGQAVIGPVATGGGGRGEGMTPETRNNPMHAARRCGARTRRGRPCRAPAMPNGRCRMHGGPSPGAPLGNRFAWKHGAYTREAIAQRREVAELIRTMRELASQLGT